MPKGIRTAIGRMLQKSMMLYLEALNDVECVLRLESLEITFLVAFTSLPRVAVEWRVPFLQTNSPAPGGWRVFRVPTCKDACARKSS